MTKSDRAPTGGAVKFYRLAKHFPHSPSKFNLIYLGSNTIPRHWQEILWMVKRRNVPIVFNQNGVFYPGWYGKGWGKRNEVLRRLIHRADYVFYQSKFCRESADLYLGRREGPSEVLHNSIDTNHFHPGDKNKPGGPLRLLLSGSQYQDFPVRCAVETLARLVSEGADAVLLITGRLTWAGGEEKSKAQLREWLSRCKLTNRVQLLGSYTQAEAPSIHHQADILLHTKYNDCCPGAVVEAMACGLPVVYSDSGGTPELVGSQAGVAVPVRQNWEQMLAPDPELMAKGVLEVARDLRNYSEAARRRAVERFGLQNWILRHREVFEDLLRDRQGQERLSSATA